MIPFHKSFAFRIFLSSFILLSLPLLVDSFVLLHKRFQESIVIAKKYLVEAPKLREFSFFELLPSKSPIAPLIENALQLKEHFPQAPSEALNKRLKEMAIQGDFVKIIIMSISEDNKYTVVGSSNSEQDVGKDETSLIRFLHVDSGQQEASLLYIAGERKYYFMKIWYIFSPEGRPIGLLVIYTDISEKLNTLLLPDLTHAPLLFAVLAQNTIILAPTDLDLLFQYFAEFDPVEKQRAVEAAAEGVNLRVFPSQPLSVTNAQEYPFFEYSWKNRSYFAAITQIGDSRFYLLTYVSKGIYSMLFSEFAHIYTTYAVILLLCGGCAYLLTRRLARPLNTLTSVMEEIQMGKENLRYSPDWLGFEINLIGETFNEMLNTLIEKKKGAEEARVKAEIYKKELALGEQVQKRLFLEKKVAPPSVDVATRYLPAREVGGDFCDLLLLDDNTYVLMIADAAGKGVEACFYSLLTRSMLRIFSKELKDVAQAISRTNSLFIQDVENSGMFVTTVLAFYTPATRQLRYCSAGHNPPLLRKQNGEVDILESYGTALGVEEKKEGRQVHTHQLYQGDIVVFYTDGITEAHNREKRLFSEKRLMEVVKQEGGRGVEYLADAIIQQIHHFENGAQQHDDITLIVMEVKDA